MEKSSIGRDRVLRLLLLKQQLCQYKETKETPVNYYFCWLDRNVGKEIGQASGQDLSNCQSFVLTGMNSQLLPFVLKSEAASSRGGEWNQSPLRISLFRLINGGGCYVGHGPSQSDLRGIVSVVVDSR